MTLRWILIDFSANAILLRFLCYVKKQCKGNMKRFYEEKRSYSVQYKNMRIIPKSMADAVEGYLDLSVPRIVEDDKMDHYSTCEQLAAPCAETDEQNLFSKVAHANSAAGNKAAKKQPPKGKNPVL